MDAARTHEEVSETVRASRQEMLDRAATILERRRADRGKVQDLLNEVHGELGDLDAMMHNELNAIDDALAAACLDRSTIYGDSEDDLQGRRDEAWHHTLLAYESSTMDPESLEKVAEALTKADRIIRSISDEIARLRRDRDDDIGNLVAETNKAKSAVRSHYSSKGTKLRGRSRQLEKKIQKHDKRVRGAQAEVDRLTRLLTS